MHLCTYIPVSAVVNALESPKRAKSSLFRVSRIRNLGGFLGGTYSSMIPRFNPIIAAWVRSLAPSLERMFLTRPLTVSSVIDI